MIGEGRARAGSEGAWARGFSQGYLPRFDVARGGRQWNGRGEYRTVLSRLDSHGAEVVGLVFEGRSGVRVLKAGALNEVLQ